MQCVPWRAVHSCCNRGQCTIRPLRPGWAPPFDKIGMGGLNRQDSEALGSQSAQKRVHLIWTTHCFPSASNENARCSPLHTTLPSSVTHSPRYWHRSLNPKKLIEVGFSALAVSNCRERTPQATQQALALLAEASATQGPKEICRVLGVHTACLGAGVQSNFARVHFGALHHSVTLFDNTALTQTRRL